MINSLRIFPTRYADRGRLRTTVRNLIAVSTVILVGFVTHSSVAAVRGGIIINIEDGSCINALT